MRKRVIIMGAMGRDLHNYIMYFKDNLDYEIVAFTAAQIPGIEEKTIPKEISGKFYSKGIRIHRESELLWLIKRYKIDYVFLCYSDLSHQTVMEKASLVLSNGANFALLGTKDTMLKSNKLVISICAVRTGAGKSQTSRAIGKILRKFGKKVVALRHSMPYGNLVEQEVQRFSKSEDFIKNKCTIEELEEYEPWVKNGFVIYAGVNYKKILKEAEKESDIIVYDSGNNDFSFLKSNLYIVVADPHRPGHEITYYPGFVNFLIADVIIINKVDSALKENIKIVENNIRKYNPKAIVIKAKSDLVIDNPELIKGKKCLAIGDGPTLSHGGMSFGAATIAVNKFKGTLIDPRQYAIGSIKETYKKYSHLQKELPAMGYSKKQIKELEETINKAKCDIVIDGSPANLKKILKVNKPIINIGYELDENSVKELENILKKKKLI